MDKLHVTHENMITYKMLGLPSQTAQNCQSWLSISVLLKAPCKLDTDSALAKTETVPKQFGPNKTGKLVKLSESRTFDGTIDGKKFQELCRHFELFRVLKFETGKPSSQGSIVPWSQILWARTFVDSLPLSLRKTISCGAGFILAAVDGCTPGRRKLWD